MSSATVLGHFPGYITLSDKLGARRFDVGPTAWAANRHFLNEMNRAGDCFVLSVNPRLVRPGTWLFRELVYLRARGVPIPRAPVWTQ